MGAFIVILGVAYFVDKAAEVIIEKREARKSNVKNSSMEIES